MVDPDEIKKRWGDPEKGSQYYADVHALMDEVKRLRTALEEIAKPRYEDHSHSVAIAALEGK